MIDNCEAGDDVVYIHDIDDHSVACSVTWGRWTASGQTLIPMARQTTRPMAIAV